MGTMQQHAAGVTAKTAASRTIPMENKQKTSFLKLTGVERKVALELKFRPLRKSLRLVPLRSEGCPVGLTHRPGRNMHQAFDTDVIKRLKPSLVSSREENVSWNPLPPGRRVGGCY